MTNGSWTVPSQRRHNSLTARPYEHCRLGDTLSSNKMKKAMTNKFAFVAVALLVYNCINNIGD